MEHPLRSLIRRVLQRPFVTAESLFDRFFGPANNPLRQLGALTFLFFWVAAVTGIYLYILFDTSVVGSYRSVEAMTHAQWYLGGIMRSLHRYSSDSMVVTAALHMAREFVFDRHRGVRWYSWLTGLFLVVLIYLSGISGYWLVWDQLAQYVAVASMEWLDWLGIFGEPLANNFLMPNSLNDRFFSLLVLVHIFVPLFLLVVIWIHIMRLSRPRLTVPRELAFGSALSLLVLSLLKPAVSQGPADLATVPPAINLDWFFLPLYPLFDALGPAILWGLVAATFLVLALLPWLPPLRRPKPAAVNLDKCSGCARCAADCPYEAITMQPRSDGRPFAQQPVVDPSRCASCGICVGACPSSTVPRRSGPLMTGIDLPDTSLARVRALMEAAMGKAKETADGRAPVIVFGCDHGARVGFLQGPGVGTVSLPCIAMLPPSFIEYALNSAFVEGVVISGCPEGSGYNREGIRWTRQRLDRTRDPSLRKRVPRERILVRFGAWPAEPVLAKTIVDFQTTLAAPLDFVAKPKSRTGTGAT